MYEIPQHIARLTKAATAYSVELPRAVVDLLDFEHDLPNLGATEAEVVEEIAAAFGTKTYAKTRDAALDRLARATVRSPIRRALDARLAEARWSAVVGAHEEIVDLFRTVTADDVEILNANAPKIPEKATATSTDLSADAYAARFNASQAASRLAEVTAALAPLYGATTPTRTIAPEHKRRMMLADLPAVLPRPKAQALVRGFGDTRLAAYSAASLSVPALWFAVVAHNGGTFRLVSREEYRENLDRMTDALRTPALGEDLPEAV